MSKDTPKKYIVYELQWSDGKTFYVGKGRPGRQYDHLCAARRGEKSHKASIIRKMWQEGREPFAVVVFETDDERLAFAEEIRLIALYGRNNLTNLTDGGDGVLGAKWKCSQETNEKKRAALVGRPKSLETRAAMSAAKKGKPLSEAQLRHNATVNIGRRHTPEARENMSAWQRGRKMPREGVEKSAASHRGLKRTDEQRAKLSELHRARWERLRQEKAAERG